MSQQSKPTSFLVLLVVLAVALLLVSSLLTPNSTQTLQYSDVLDLFRNEKVASFTLEGSSLTMQVRGDGDATSTTTAKIGDTEQFRADLDDLIAEQYAAGTLKSYNYLPASDPWYRAAAPYIIGGIVLLIVFFFLSSRANGGPNGMANFTKANARFGIPTSQTVTFQDVAGADEEKEELAQIVTRSAGILHVPIEPSGAMEIARRSRGTPRIANRMLRRVRDFAEVKADGTITDTVADQALQALEIDHLGLDPVDRRMLRAIIENYGGGPVGLETLAATIGEESVTLEDVYEPYLMQLGFLTRTPRGRCVTKKAYDHLHMAYLGQEQMTL